MTSSTRDVVTNTSPLLYLHQLGLINLLPQIFQRLVVPSAVIAELAEGQGLGYDVPSPSAFAWVEIAPPVVPITQAPTGLGPGEREAIALAVTRRSDLILLDDGLARRYASGLGLAVTGTLGVILRAKQRGHLAAVSPVLDRLTGLGSRLAAETRAGVVKLADE